ncbi:MAG TPA: polysaccharide deacetylase family protein [Myxococcales bacterium]|nr:polysaccharide deacetylase family protein [Myxococcales bacterium]
MLWSVSVDLDGIGCYAAIHGLPEPLEDRARRAVPHVALERLCELFDSLPVKATLFVIGREAAIAPEGLRAAAAAGHEIASHSFAHHYGMSRWPKERVAADLQQCEEELTRLGLPLPRGFRAPGYTLSKSLLEALSERGYSYDSSLLPSPPYYAAKAVAMGVHRLAGRKSHSILGGPLQLFARRRAHFRLGVRELPISTTPVLRAPVIGTSVLALPWLARAGAAGGHFNLELHGIDALDATDVPADVAARQPGIALPAKEKLHRLRALLKSLPGEGVTLSAAAQRLLPH